MKQLSFSFSPIKPKSNRITKRQYEIIEKGIDGVLKITPSFSYECIIDNKSYIVTEESYDCKNKSIVYSQSSYIRIQVPVDKRIFNNNRYVYAPFRSGSLVQGDIVRNVVTGITYFDVKNIFVDSNNDFGRACLKYWRDNYEELELVRIQKLSESYD